MHNNRIISNVTPVWVVCGYGTAIETKIYNNTFIKAPGATVLKQVRMGSFEQEICIAENVEFRSNEFQGMEFSIDATSQHHSYKVSWTLDIKTGDANAVIQVTDKNGKEVVNRKTDKRVTLLWNCLNILLTAKTRHATRPKPLQPEKRKKW